MGLRNTLRKGLRDWGFRVPDALLKDDEPFMRRVAQTLKKTDTVLDLGAHIGICSIEFAHHAGKVFAVEPHPENYGELVRNTRAYRNISPLNVAVSDQTGTTKLYFEAPDKKGRNFEGATLMSDKSNISYERAFDVKSVTLADLIQDAGSDVALIKMDIEGAEYRVIEALIETPAVAKVGKVFVEDHCDRIPGLADHRARVEARIDALGLRDRFDFTWP
ncbi:MAG: FkbM family methyltransferase [Pseudomonadota bacterium]